MLILSAHELTDLVPLPELVAAVENTARALAEGRIAAPKRQHLEWGANTLLTMPAISDHAVGVKLVTVAPGNAARGLAVTNGVMVLNDHQTGAPIALINAATLTAMRTGAVGALGVKHLTPDDVSTMGVIGCGVQGAWQAIFACVVRPIREIYCVYRSPASFERFSATVSTHAPQAKIIACEDARALLQRTDLIVAATTSAEPVLPDDLDALAGKHFISVGSYRKDMQELPTSVYRLAGAVFVDSPAAYAEVGDLIRTIERGVVPASQIIYIGELVSGKRSVDVARTSAYKTVGLALYDLDVAQALYAAALRKRVGREISL